ncbi:MAG: hypothetical protein M3P22_02445 [bacterium]|nr:hypothetical protein [bacterium]
MNRKKLLNRTALSIVFIFVLNFLANKLYWYSSFWYFDMIMHTLGGFFILLAIIYVFKINNLDFKSIVLALLGVFIVGISWEVFEFVFNNVLAGQVFNIYDTLSDICFDMLGGILALFYSLKRIM